MYACKPSCAYEYRGTKAPSRGSNDSVFFVCISLTTLKHALNPTYKPKQLLLRLGSLGSVFHTQLLCECASPQGLNTARLAPLAFTTSVPRVDGWPGMLILRGEAGWLSLLENLFFLGSLLGLAAEGATDLVGQTRTCFRGEMVKGWGWMLGVVL